MERIKDPQVVRLIEQIGDHYRTNISNSFLRPILLQLQIDKPTWDLIEVLTEKMEMFRYHGFHLDDLYRQIAACSRMVESARHNMIPSLRTKLNAIPGGHDKILREMAANNFASNLQVWAELLNELYLILVDMDQMSAGKNQPIFTQIPELGNVSRHLVGH